MVAVFRNTSIDNPTQYTIIRRRYMSVMAKKKIRPEEALEYHSSGRKGKIEVVSTKPCSTQYELSLAYSPGVAEPCRAIAKDEELVYEYTAKGNLVGVISNGTAVLGLGNIGASASKPVMEGKGVLFKKFSDIDVFDIEVKTQDPEEFINTVANLEPTFGGINLEDVKSPECFYIEQELQQRMQIPVFHDDQHGTAIITGAALLNACEIQNKKLDEIIVVNSGGGAAAISCCRFYVRMGVRKENIFMCDEHGLIYPGREIGMNPFKEEFANGDGPATLADMMKHADVFLGLSVGGIVSKDMIASMPPRPIVFALANPDPEITYNDADSVRSDIIVATGRSDYPNQVNNVLGFPYIFRGALDVRAKAINDEMKLAAAYALAELAKSELPDSVLRAYGDENIRFGRSYIIPKPLDPRVLTTVAPAVAQAAIESGVARHAIMDFEEYAHQLQARQGKAKQFVARVISGVVRRASKKRIVLTDGEEPKVIRAAEIIADEGIAKPILLGNREKIETIARQLHIDITPFELIDTYSITNLEYANTFAQLRQRKGVTLTEAHKMMRRRPYYGAMMVHMGDADGLLSGLNQRYDETVRPALEIIGRDKRYSRIAGMYIIMTKRGETLFFADTSITINPNAEELADIAMMTAEVAERFHVEPRVAMLSFSDFGTTRDSSVNKIHEAITIVKKKRPHLVIEGEMQADTAIFPDKAQEQFPFSAIQGDANVLVFPELNSANIAYKLLMRVGEAEAVGPILVGINKPVYILERDAGVQEIVNMAAMCADEVLEKELIALG